MPGDESAGERTEEATDHRRRQERERGRAAKSRDLAASAVLLAGMSMLNYGGHTIYRWLYCCTERYLGEDIANKPIPSDMEIYPYVLEWVAWMAFAAGPFLLAILFVALAINFIQVGFLFSWDPLMPDLNRLNPVSGAKRIVSLRSLMTLVFNILKLSCVVAVSYITLMVEIPRSTLLSDMEPAAILAQSAQSVATLGMRLALLFFILGIFDFGYQLYQQGKDMMMTKQEVKEEIKQHEGDPLLRARRRQIQRQLAQQRMMQEVPQAEVVVRNPTHFAVAVKYKPEMEAPLIVAKGADHMAQRIIKAAIENGVPVWQAPPLARKLYKLEIGDQIPAQLFPALAEVLAHVLKGEKLEQYRRSMKKAA